MRDDQIAKVAHPQCLILAVRGPSSCSSTQGFSAMHVKRFVEKFQVFRLTVLVSAALVYPLLLDKITFSASLTN